ncbi:MAG: hypothetical protein V2A77_00770 [Pseudomonadota bacterium]
MPPQEVDFTEILVTPVSEMIRQIAAGIAEAQRQLDSAALDMQSKLKQTHPELAAVGYQVPWYTMPDVEVELKLAAHYETKGDGGGKARLLFALFNAKYQNAFNYTADGTSTLKVKIVAVPPQIVEQPAGG